MLVTLTKTVLPGYSFHRGDPVGPYNRGSVLGPSRKFTITMVPAGQPEETAAKQSLTHIGTYTHTHTRARARARARARTHAHARSLALARTHTHTHTHRSGHLERERERKMDA